MAPFRLLKTFRHKLITADATGSNGAAPLLPMPDLASWFQGRTCNKKKGLVISTNTVLMESSLVTPWYKGHGSLCLDAQKYNFTSNLSGEHLKVFIY